MGQSAPTTQKSNLLPYDYVKANQIIAIEEAEGCRVISTAAISIETYHELSRYLNQDFKMEICDADRFDELLTGIFSTGNGSATL